MFSSQEGFRWHPRSRDEQPQAEAKSEDDDEPDGAARHGGILRQVSGASVGGLEGRLNHRVNCRTPAATTRSRSFRIGVTDALARFAFERQLS